MASVINMNKPADLIIDNYARRFGACFIVVLSVVCLFSSPSFAVHQGSRLSSQEVEFISRNVIVKSLLPNEGLEIDDKDGDSNTKTFVIPIAASGDLTITAVPEPRLDEAELPAEWTLTGGSGTSKLVRTISKSSTSKTTLTCTCGSSSKTTTIYVYKAELYLYADAGDWSTDKYGHSWWELKCDNDIKGLIKTLNPGLTYERFFGIGGWWPDMSDPNIIVDPIKGWAIKARGKVIFGRQSIHIPTGSKHWQIGYRSFVNALNYAKDLEKSGQNWTVYSNNCTDQAVLVGNSAGIHTISIFGVTSPRNLSDWLNSH